ncbi:putative DNA polymerase beta domain protein region [Candidatus Terasakiella magnetica]|uniref:Putative DNA polymerase beta domain protein region n=1 Tax=Candidatus Terasakiella magnetica TaxID=1867952 RepID=A0A1C3REN1_9PROT|nr:nucleotidyltransferase family protein [Candidatus Terasakiella magnetica]SCA55750.1 putative DNA polymerase beta domain protein region [Candidatus Terasakiella magnetica]
MTDKADIFKKLSTMQDELDEFGIARIGLFGSYARGTPRSDSDIDMLVEFYETPGLIQLAELHIRLEESFGRRVDIATTQMLSADLKDNVLSEVIFDDKTSQA